MSEILDSTQQLEDTFNQISYQQWQKGFEKSSNDSRENYRRLEESNFDFFKNSTILAGTVFGSTLALSTGKSIQDVNYFLVLGEVLLMFSIIIGLISLKTSLNVKEWTYLFNEKNKIDGNLILYRKVMPEFIVTANEDLAQDFQKLMDKPTFIKLILKMIRPTFIEPIFYTFLTSGLFCLWLSLFLTI